MLLVSSPLRSCLCALLPRQDVQPDALPVRGERWLRHIVRSQRSQTARITNQLHDSASLAVSKWTVQCLLHRKGFRSRRPTRVPMLKARHRAAGLAWEREHRYWSVDSWKGVAWSD
ncbi:HTH_Tnp_Tc3_2 domain-containing protein [Trichonephila clavipes]|nr:HTH_Tnp_Tc3_2 domain-containing protein [Trichonephila clavipes]